MPKLYDLADDWLAMRRKGSDGLLRYVARRPLHLRERNASATSPDRNNEQSIIAEAYACTFDSADPDTVAGSEVIVSPSEPEGAPHPFVPNAEVVGFEDFRILNQFEATFVAVYEILYPFNQWGAIYSGLISVRKDEFEENADIEYLCEVPNGWKYGGPCRRTRSVVIYTLSALINVTNPQQLQNMLNQMQKDVDKIREAPLFGQDQATANSVYLAPRLIPDPSTAAQFGGIGRYKVEERYRIKARVKTVEAVAGHHIEIPEVPANGEISITFASGTGAPRYEVKSVTQLYEKIQ